MAGAVDEMAGADGEQEQSWMHAEAARTAIRRMIAVAHALEVTGGNVDAAARALGVHRITLHRWLRAWGWQRQPGGSYGPGPG